MDERFSVLMSVYQKEKPAYLRKCFESLLQQTCPADEWVLVEDGPLTTELYAVIAEYNNKFPGLMRIIPLKNNVQLGLALREGILHCSFPLIARMDTDDICRKDRFEKQLIRFQKNPNLDICGSYIQEFDMSPEELGTIRRVPLQDAEIRQYQKRRSAFNHMTVMYKKDAVLRAGNYEHAPLMEDDMLWVRMLLDGSYGENIDECLVYVRTGRDMIRRRGGWRYFCKYCQARKKILGTGYISHWDYLYTAIVQFAVTLMPSWLRGVVFQRLLRSPGSATVSLEE